MAQKYNEDEMLNIAEAIIQENFKDKKDKGGHPYLDHLYVVRDKVKKYDKKTEIIALLHDVLKYTSVTEKDLASKGISKAIITSLKTINLKRTESYEAYINRIANSGDMRAIHVKIADLTHNIDISRIENPTQSDFDRVKKYQKALNTLIEG